MKVILRSDVPKLGHKHDVVDVADGYGRNYLIPQGVAEHATERALAQIEQRRAQQEAQRTEQVESIRKALEPIVKTGITITASANEKGHLFAALHADDIAEALKKEINQDVPMSIISLEKDIKNVGDSTVRLMLTEDETLELPVTVSAK